MELWLTTAAPKLKEQSASLNVLMASFEIQAAGQGLESPTPACTQRFLFGFLECQFGAESRNAEFNAQGHGLGNQQQKVGHAAGSC